MYGFFVIKKLVYINPIEKLYRKSYYVYLNVKLVLFNYFTVLMRFLIIIILLLLIFLDYLKVYKLFLFNLLKAKSW